MIRQAGFWALLLLLLGCGSGGITQGAVGVGEEGQDCAPSGAFACEGSAAGSFRELTCDEGVFRLHAACPGGCRVQATEDGTFVFCAAVAVGDAAGSAPDAAGDTGP